jgi:hypothetical protein
VSPTTVFLSIVTLIVVAAAGGALAAWFANTF